MLLRIFAVLCTILVPGLLKADVILNAVDVKQYVGLFLNPTQNIYATGYFSVGFDESYCNGTFVFDLPLGTPQITSAYFRIYSPSLSYASIAPNENLYLHLLSQSTAQQVLANANNSVVGGQITAGPIVGSKTYSVADDSSYANIPLSPQAVAAFNAQIGSVFGLSSDVPTFDGRLFETANASTLSSFPVQLVVTPVPEPASAVLLGFTACAGFVLGRPRKRVM